MHQLLSSTIEKIRKASHMHELLDKADLKVCFICEEEQWLVHFQGRNVHIESKLDSVGDVVIEGSLEAFRLLLNGDDFLLSMKKRGELGISGNLKDLLLLESILYLSKGSTKTSL
ncbi:hypothetical protein J2S74_005074 [Evansella vedderi]|uniref:SCP2 domain-containing protein n=1 Tax=Evansella vedderi TaxID=38282 RepID=A0ABU0A296_9BACI|nr:SCP2 sterol-binding domain-containing protein [Evansella vedderi]MDQ0257612.1 hypothetical protein [Evansella vedderi]